MNKHELRRQVANEVKGLSPETLTEVLHFIQFLKIKTAQKTIRGNLSENNLKNELDALNAMSMNHLEEEFTNYKELYPYDN